MKALDKATQDRDKAPAGNAAAAAEKANRELALEAIDTGRDAQSMANRSRATSGHSAASTQSPTNGPARSNAQMQAANVLASSRQSVNPGALAWLQVHPLHGIGIAAALFLAAYGAYVYVQIAQPSWLRKTTASPPVAVTPPAAPSPAPAAAPPATTTESAAPSIAEGSGSQVVPMSSVFGRGGDFLPAQVPAQTMAPPRKPAPPVEPAPAAAPALKVAPRVAVTPDTPARAPPTILRDKIAIGRSDHLAPRVNPTVHEAYTALQAGQFDAAQRLYRDALRGEPANVDALLGLAAIAQQQNRPEEAQRHYLAILDAEPRHALAQSGLISLMGRADPQASESRLKQLIAREPSAPLYFNLGNLYAEQGLWAQAQQAYFQAHHLEPRNPDYAYNLAIGLEHLGQAKLALDFYRKALQLASSAGAAHFDTVRAQERVNQLAARAN